MPDPVNNVDDFLGRIMAIESSGDVQAYNKDSGAFGLFQFIPSTWTSQAKAAGVDPTDTSGAAQYKVARHMAEDLYSKYGSWEAAAAGWYGGPGMAQLYKNNPQDSSLFFDQGKGYPSVTQYITSVMNSKPMDLTGFGGGSTDTPGAGSTAAAPYDPASTQLSAIPGDADLQSAYGWAAALADVPDLKKVLDDAVAQKWGSAQIQAAVRETAWYKERNTNQVNWEIEKRLHPNDAFQKANDLARGMQQAANKLGFNLDNDRANKMAVEALTNGATSQQQQKMVENEFHYSAGDTPRGDAAVTVSALRKVSSDYMVPVSDQTLSGWVDSIVKGTNTVDGFNTYIQGVAKGMYTGLAGQINEGTPTRTLLDPYKQVAEKELGQPVDLEDPKIYGALFQTDPKTGTRTMPNVDQFRTYIRTDPRFGWNGTTNASNMAAATADSLAKDFGMPVG